MGYDMYIVQKDEDEEKRVAEAHEAFNRACKERDELPEDWKGSYEEGEIEALAAAGKHPFDTPPKNRHPQYEAAQAKVDIAYQAMRDAEKSYFRLNIFGMSRVAAMMVELGAAREGYRHREWPHLGPWMREGQAEPVNMDNWYWQWLEAEEDGGAGDDYQVPPAEVKAAFEAHRIALKKHREWSPLPEFPEDARVPIHKFGSNDGWLVTEEECAYAAKVLKEAREKDGANYVAVLAKHGWDTDEARRYFDQWVEFLETASKRGGFTVH